MFSDYNLASRPLGGDSGINPNKSHHSGPASEGPWTSSFLSFLINPPLLFATPSACPVQEPWIFRSLPSQQLPTIIRFLRPKHVTNGVVLQLKCCARWPLKSYKLLWPPSFVAHFNMPQSLLKRELLGGESETQSSRGLSPIDTSLFREVIRYKPRSKPGPQFY